MSNIQANPSFGTRVKDLFNKSLSNSIVIEKDDRRVLHVPVLVVIVAAILAIWLVAILGIAALLWGYSIRLERPASEPLIEGTTADTIESESLPGEPEL